LCSPTQRAPRRSCCTTDLFCICEAWAQPLRLYRSPMRMRAILLLVAPARVITYLSHPAVNVPTSSYSALMVDVSPMGSTFLSMLPPLPQLPENVSEYTRDVICHNTTSTLSDHGTRSLLFSSTPPAAHPWKCFNSIDATTAWATSAIASPNSRKRRLAQTTIHATSQGDGGKIGDWHGTLTNWQVLGRDEAVCHRVATSEEALACHGGWHLTPSGTLFEHLLVKATSSTGQAVLISCHPLDDEPGSRMFCHGLEDGTIVYYSPLA